MSDVKWTPGPWGAADHGVGDLVVFSSGTQKAICVFDDAGQVYAWPDGYCTSGEAEANADLIAAAPDFAENAVSDDVLREAANALTDLGADGSLIEDFIAWHLRNRTALAKAQGES